MRRLKHVGCALEVLERRVLLSGAVAHWGRDNSNPPGWGHAAEAARSPATTLQPTATVQPAAGGATVVGRWLFYNQSVFDGGNAAINSADDGALAPDKQPCGVGAGPVIVQDRQGAERDGGKVVSTLGHSGE